MENDLVLVTRQDIIGKRIADSISLRNRNIIVSCNCIIGDIRHDFICGVAFNRCFGFTKLDRDISIKSITVNINTVACTSHRRNDISDFGCVGCRIVLPNSYFTTIQRDRCRSVDSCRGIDADIFTVQHTTEEVHILTFREQRFHIVNGIRFIRLAIYCNKYNIIIELPLVDKDIIIAVTNRGSTIRNGIILLTQFRQLANQLVRRCICIKRTIRLHEDTSRDIAAICGDNILLRTVVDVGNTTRCQQRRQGCIVGLLASLRVAESRHIVVIEKRHCLIFVVVIVLRVLQHIAEVRHRCREIAKGRGRCAIKLEIKVVYARLLREIDILVIFRVRPPDEKLTELGDRIMRINRIFQPLCECRIHMERGIMADTVYTHIRPEQSCLFQICRNILILL